MRRASVTWVSGRSEIGPGLVALVGVGPHDDERTAERVAEKVLQLRIFEDAQGRTNLSLADVGGQLLAISQFTLFADISRGRRPGFTGAAGPELAERIYDRLLTALRERGAQVAAGRFGADMDVELVNQGPFTLLIDTDTLAG